MRLFSLLTLISVCGLVHGAVTTVETRISADDATSVMVEHSLTGIRDNAHVPMPGNATDLQVLWEGEQRTLDYREGWDKPPAQALMPHVQDGPILFLMGSGDRAVVRYRLPLSQGAVVESLGAARLYRASATVALAVNLDGNTIPYSPSHDLEAGQLLSTPENQLPDTPLVLMPLKPGPGKVDVKTLSVAPNDGQEGYLLIAMAGRAAETRPARRIAFALDISGSMQGEKLSQAKQALKDSLNRLGKDDRFELISFNHEVTRHMTSNGEIDTNRLLDALQSGGNTNLSGAMLLPAQENLDVDTVVVLTDGLPTAGIVDENEIKKVMSGAYDKRDIGIHAIGVGYDVNAPLLDSVAGSHGGGVAYVRPGQDVRAAVTTMLTRLGATAARNTSVAIAGTAVKQPLPAMDALGDMVDGEVMVMVARYSEAGPMTIRFNERHEGVTRELASRDIELPNQTPAAHRVIERLWASRLVAQVEANARQQNRGMTREEVNLVNKMNFDQNVWTNTNLEQINSLNQGLSLHLSRDAYANKVKSFKDRSGQLAIIQSIDNFRAQSDSQAVVIYDNEGNQVPLNDRIYNSVAGNAVRNGDIWVDGDIAAEESENGRTQKRVVVQRGSKEYNELVHKALENDKGGLLSLEGEVEIALDETYYLVEGE